MNNPYNNKLMEMKLADLISDEEFTNKKSEYKKREMELKVLIGEAQQQDDKTLKSFKDLFAPRVPLHFIARDFVPLEVI